MMLVSVLATVRLMSTTYYTQQDAGYCSPVNVELVYLLRGTHNAMRGLVLGITWWVEQRTTRRMRVRRV